MRVTREQEDRIAEVMHLQTTLDVLSAAISEAEYNSDWNEVDRIGKEYDEFSERLHQLIG